MERAAGAAVPTGVRGAKTDVPRLGMHVSIAGGMEKMAERARDFGCETVQIFSRSPRGGEARPLEAAEVGEARRILEAAGVRPLVIHVPYFANLATRDENLRQYAVETLKGELERAALLGSPYVVSHLGRPAKGDSDEAGLKLAARSVLEVFERLGDSAGGVMLLLENTAGAGREIGWRLEELGDLHRRVDPACGGRVGICLDTCHAQAAGYDLGGPEGVAEFARLAARVFGPGEVRVIHANDALGEAGSHKDRHAPIGEGTIGETGFRALLGETFFADCPFLLETPGTDEERALDLERLKHIRAGEPLGNSPRD